MKHSLGISREIPRLAVRHSWSSGRHEPHVARPDTSNCLSARRAFQLFRDLFQRTSISITDRPHTSERCQASLRPPLSRPGPVLCSRHHFEARHTFPAESEVTADQVCGGWGFGYPDLSLLPRSPRCNDSVR